MRVPSSSLWAVVASAACLLGSTAAAFDPAVDTTYPNDGICLSSFIWCNGDGSSCSFPEHADALSPGAPFAVLYHGEKYDITWRQADSGLPVLVEWLFEPSLAQDDAPARTVMWSTNVTSDSFTFDPEAILGGFPTDDAPSVSSAQAIVGSHGPSNQIRISQPASGFAAVWSSQFLVHTGWTEQLVTTIKEAEGRARADGNKKWQLGVGIGVGLGLPALVVATWFLASRRRPSETISVAK